MHESSHDSRCCVRSCFLVLSLWAALSALGQNLEIKPRRILADDPLVIRVHNLRPSEKIAIKAQLTDGAGKLWVSEAEFVAGEDGVVDVSRQSPIRGSYDESSSTGLIWSMKPVASEVSAYRFPQDLAEQRVTFSLVRAGEVISEQYLDVITLSEGVKRIPVRDSEVTGVLFLPRDPGPHPGVLVFGGSEGGVSEQNAAWLAARGFTAFALAYFHYDDLPRRLEAIPLEYFERGLVWMTKRPEVRKGGGGVLGGSRGAELALQLASMFPAIRCVVAIAPGNVRYRAQGGGEKVDYAWTWKGKPLPYVAQRGDPSSEAMMEAEIAVERTNGPILLVSGEDDRLWPAAQMGDAMVARLKKHQFRHPVEHLKYAEAGHFVGGTVLFPRWRSSTVKHRITGNLINLGGTPRADALSSVDAMPRVLTFLRTSLH
jgi:dienelactone hydrolase